MIERVAEREGAELARRERAYRGDRPPLELRRKDRRARRRRSRDRGDDAGGRRGGAGAGAAVRRRRRADRAAARRPRAASEASTRSSPLIAARPVPRRRALVRGLPRGAGRRGAPTAAAACRGGGRRGRQTEAALVVPDGARGLVVFAHGSGSSRFSPRNRFVAGVLEDAGLATLLVDLLTKAEEQVDLRTREHPLRRRAPGRSRRGRRCAGRRRTSERIVCGSACSAPAPAQPPRSRRPRASRRPCAPSSPGAAGPTWQGRRSPTSARRRC